MSADQRPGPGHSPDPAAPGPAAPGAPSGAARPAGTPLVLGTWSARSGTGLWGQALPASSWREVLGDVPVTLEIEGGPATLWSARSGRRRRRAARVVERLTLRLEADGPDWFWVEGPVRAVTWSTDAAVELPPVTVVMPTRGREQDAIAQSARFARMDAVHRVIVVDQGGTLADLPEVARLRAEHPQITLLSQPNLGGSGGYARGMLEASADPAAAVLFSDDDAVLSEESLRRMLTYQALAARPTILGAPLFSSARPTRLLAHAERVGARAFQWRSADHLHGAVDLAGTTPEDWTFVTSRGPANYTGWWGTLFPPGTAEELGLPAPLFLKWDDAEYGLRATARGYDHAVLPGTSVHHPPWTAYRTQMTWTARVLHRNRLAIAAAYGAGRGVIASSLLHQLKHVLSGHLLTADLWEDAVDAMRAGPEGWMGSDLQRARADGERVVDAWHRDHDLPPSTAATRRTPLALPAALSRALLRMLRSDRPPRVVLAVHADDVHWRATLGADALLVTADDGSTESAFAVRGSDMRRALRRSLRSHLGLAVRWRSLSRRYRAALPRHTTPDSWAALFAAAPTERT
jgi:galactofuranosylgalactofuranosylrhamnosyl-N-acetylglucosaminyl-diphospho-decaprenol beta-1,5/1,6-galactofuranosyltransferase